LPPGILLLLILPFSTAWIAAQLTVRDVKEEAYEILCLTSMTNLKLVQGYLFASLYRIRLGLTAGISLSPVIIAQLISSRLNMITCNSGSMIPCYNDPTTPLAWEWIVWVFMLVEVFASVLGMIPLAAAIGVWLGLWWRRTISIVGSIFVTVLFSVPTAFILQLVVVEDQRHLPTRSDIILLTTFYLICTYILVIGIIYLGQHWARKEVTLLHSA
jgi:hypothetical protein